jgi:hypothetical protein
MVYLKDLTLKFFELGELRLICSYSPLRETFSAIVEICMMCNLKFPNTPWYFKVDTTPHKSWHAHIIILSNTRVSYKK